MDERHQPQYYQFADLEWQSRWNDPRSPHLALYQEGHKLMVTGVMGVLRLDLDKSADQVAVVQQLRSMAKAIEETQLRYTTFKEEWLYE